MHRQLTLRTMEQAVAMMVLMVWARVKSDLVDIQDHTDLILQNHNGLRRSVEPPASDMREMIWDEALALDAEEWSKYCRYSRPPKHMYNWGANLAYVRGYVHTSDSVRTNVIRGLDTWARERQYFQYGTDCGISCSYTQMVYAATNRVGCAMNKCEVLQVGNTVEMHSSLFICFYAPKGRLMEMHPYHPGDTCSNCPKNTKCSDGLCADRYDVVVSLRGPVAALVQPKTLELSALELARDQAYPGNEWADELTDSEVTSIIEIHNMCREKNGCRNLTWDAKLQRWSDWIVSCRADYPGPSYSYSNFYRGPRGLPIVEAVYEWNKEGNNTNIQMGKGCRTAYDLTKCNHYTNMMQTTVKALACSARNCGDGTRQLVCLYGDQSYGSRTG